jgi:hypothetical protein
MYSLAVRGGKPLPPQGKKVIITAETQMDGKRARHPLADSLGSVGAPSGVWKLKKRIGCALRKAAIDGMEKGRRGRAQQRALGRYLPTSPKSFASPAAVQAHTCRGRPL